MRYLKYVALVAVLMLPLAYSQAQVRVGIGVGPVGVAVGGAPVCAYGYYGYAPYTCAPSGRARSGRWLPRWWSSPRRLPWRTPVGLHPGSGWNQRLQSKSTAEIRRGALCRL
jgi:hypothetical protein